MDKFTKYMSSRWKMQAVIAGLNLINVQLAIALPYLTKLIIDKAYSGRDLRMLLALSVAGGAIFVVNGLLDILTKYLSRRLRCRIQFNITKDVFAHLQNLPLSFFVNRPSGSDIFRLDRDVDVVSRFTSSFFLSLAKLFPQLIFTFGVIFFIDRKMMLVSLLLIPLVIFHSRVFNRWIMDMNNKMLESSQNVFYGILEFFSHMPLIKAFGSAKYEAGRFCSNLEKRIGLELANSRLSDLAVFSNSLLLKICAGVVFFYGFSRVINGNMTLGNLSAVMLYFVQIASMFETGRSLWENRIAYLISRRRLMEILDAVPQRPVTGFKKCPAGLKWKVDFCNVSFSYHPSSVVINDLSFSILPSSKVALVGHSGCGKTTLLYLILKLYDPRSGRILVDGVDIMDIPEAEFKMRVGVAMQETFLWDKSVSWNISYGAEGLTMEEIVKAARVAEADEFISKMPHGYDTVIGDMACRISEGQKQRLALARAIAKKPGLLLLDEAMSCLDSECEDAILRNIRAELADSTVILVSHRISAVKQMDSVCFFEHPGKVVSASHEELLKTSVHYRRIFSSQA